MEQNRKLNITDEWEDIINETSAQRNYARMVWEKNERERKLKKMWLTACGIAVLGMTYLILGLTGAVADWFASAVAIFSIAGGSFVFGRYVEAKKK